MKLGINLGWKMGVADSTRFKFSNGQFLGGAGDDLIDHDTLMSQNETEALGLAKSIHIAAQFKEITVAQDEGNKRQRQTFFMVEEQGNISLRGELAMSLVKPTLDRSVKPIQ